MEDSRQPEDSASQWDPSGGQEPGGTHGANGYSSSAYRTCQTGAAPMATGPYSTRENGFNGELRGAHAITAEQVSARIVQEVTAEAVAVLKGEQETQRLPSVEDTTNLPPSPPPSPAAEHVGPVERDVGDEEEAGPLRRFQNSRERCKFLAPSISVSVPEDDPYHSDEEYYEHPLFSPEWTHSGSRSTGQAVAFRQIEEETMEALTAEYEEQVEEESEGALDEQQSSGEEPELEEAKTRAKAQDLDLEPPEAASAAAESSVDKEEEEVEDEEEAKGEESPETALKMDLKKQDSGSISPDSIGSEKPPEEIFEPQMQGFFAGERVVPESPTIDMPSFVLQNQAKDSARSITLQPTYGEPITVSEKQPSVEVVEFTSIGGPADFSLIDAKVQGGDSTKNTQDRSGMSAYFETSAMEVDKGNHCKGEGYYELSRAGEEESAVDSKSHEISFNTLAEDKNKSVPRSSISESNSKFTVPDKSNECKLSPGKLALEQRSYSLNITIGAVDQSGQSKQRNLPLAPDIMSHTSGSLDESTDHCPVTTPSVDKPPPFPPLILETAASVTSDSSSPPKTVERPMITFVEPDSPESPDPTKNIYKNGTIMAQDLPEMLDLAGANSRLSSENTEPDMTRRKSFQGDIPPFGDDLLAGMVSGELSPGIRKSDSQLEEGYCVFSEYSGPMPSPADLFSPTTASTKVFTPSVLEEKVAEQARKMAVRDISVEDKSPTLDVTNVVQENDQQQENRNNSDNKEVGKDQLLISVNDVPLTKPSESFVTPTVMVTLEGGMSVSETERQASGDGSASETEIADYERQIRKLEMEDRPLSVEEERELQELREKVKLVHQEAYEEVDAEDVYQLTGVAKDRIARPVKTSPASSVESNIEDDKLLSPVLSPAKLQQKELYGSPKRASSPVLGISNEGRDKSDGKIREEQAKEAVEQKIKEEQERKSMEEAEKKEVKEREEKEKLQKEMVKKEEAERLLREEKEKKEKEQKQQEEIDRLENEKREQEQKLLKEKEDREKRETEERERKEKEQREKDEQEEKMMQEKERMEQSLREKENKEMLMHEEEECAKMAEMDQKDSRKSIGEAKLSEDMPIKKPDENDTDNLNKDENVALNKAEVPESCAAIESVVTVEDDFITVVQTIDEAEEPGHSVRFSAPPEAATTDVAAVKDDEEEDEESVEMAEEAEMEAADPEEVVNAPGTPYIPERNAQTVETEGTTESYDRDETTMDDSILDSSWIDTQDDDRSMVTEATEPLPRGPKPVKKSAVVDNKQTQQRKTDKQEKAVKPKTKSGRTKGRIATPERKPFRNEPVFISREEIKKKKAVVRKSEFTKKMETQSQSPSKRSALKVRQTRPVQHHSCPRRRYTEALPDSRQPLSVARQSRDRASCHIHPHTKIPKLIYRPVLSIGRPHPCSAELLSSSEKNRSLTKDGGSRSPVKRASVPRHTSILSRRVYHDHEDSSTSITSSGSTAPRRPTSFRPEMRAEHRTGRAPSMTATESVRSRSARSGHSSPRTPGSTAITPGSPPSYSSSSRTRTPRSLSLISQERKVAVVHTPPKSPATTPKQLRIISEPLPDYKNIKSKIGSIENIKYQPKGGQKQKEQNVTTEVKRRSSFIWKSLLRFISVTLCLSAANSVTWTQDLLIDILNKKLDLSQLLSKRSTKENLKASPCGAPVLIPSVRLDYSHVQARCGSLDRRGYSAKGGNIQIQNKKIDLSHVTSKCGSLDNIHHRPGGGHVRIENVKLDFKDKAQAKVGSLDKAHHIAGGGRVMIESHRVGFREQARARVDHGAEIVIQSPGFSGIVSPHQHQDSHLSSCGSINATESAQLANLAEDVTAALTKQGL